jgi:hypothetical protein
MKYGNYPGNFQSDYGIVIIDNTDGMKLQKMVRKMAVYNPVPNMAAFYGSGYRDIPIIKTQNARLQL